MKAVVAALVAVLLAGCSSKPVESRGLGDAFASVDPSNWEQVLEQARGRTVQVRADDDADRLAAWIGTFSGSLEGLWAVTVTIAGEDDEVDLVWGRADGLDPAELLTGWNQHLPAIRAGDGRRIGDQAVRVDHVPFPGEAFAAGHSALAIRRSSDEVAAALVVANWMANGFTFIPPSPVPTEEP